MASCLQSPMISYSSPLRTTHKRTTTIITNSTATFNPQDPFLKKLALAHSIATSPVQLQSFKSKSNDSDSDSDSLPYLDVFESPTLMATPAQSERSVSSYAEHKPRRPPPDIPSMLLDGRIVYIGMPLVPVVTELVIAQLLYLQWTDPKSPIYLYISSTGTTRDDGEPVGLESEGFAIYDALMRSKCEIHTLNIGCAIGHACLLLASGTKGKRFTMPHAKALLQQPKVPASGLMQTTDVLIRAKEVKTNLDTLTELLAKHTDHSIEEMAKAIKNPLHMNAAKAIEFGVVDKVLWRGKETMASEIASSQDWDKRAGIKGI